MNQEIKAKWVAALRSGQYKQCRGYLIDEGWHCCLGVLCELSKQETGFGIAENLVETSTDENIGATVRVWADLPYDYGADVTINGIKNALTNHNDEGRTFLQIADAIEEQL